MNKTAFDVTIVLVGESDKYGQFTQADLLSALHSNKLEYYGDIIESNNGKPIIYLTPKKEQ